MSMTKLNNQRKITHRAQKNPRKSDLMTENKHKRKLYDEGELQKKKNNYHVTDNTDIRHHASDACHYCGAVFIVTLFLTVTLFVQSGRGRGQLSYENEGYTHQKIRIKRLKESLIHSMTEVVVYCVHIHLICNLVFIKDFNLANVSGEIFIILDL